MLSGKSFIDSSRQSNGNSSMLTTQKQMQDLKKSFIEMRNKKAQKCETMSFTNLYNKAPLTTRHQSHKFRPVLNEKHDISTSGLLTSRPRHSTV